MTTSDIITHLFCLVDDRMKEESKHPQATLYPSEVVTIGLLFALIRRTLSCLCSLAEPRLCRSVSGVARPDPPAALVQDPLRLV